MKTFKDWIEETHPEQYDEFLSNNKFVQGAKNLAGKAAVGLKRAGEKVDKFLGDDPHMRQRANRKNNKDANDFSNTIKDL